ncbi:MAG: signal peptide peptidase SppA [Verrucomicrobiota bacterium]|nr:signal peptide peptidase SppA [Verrucomicrobiota bacterium]
MENPPPFNSGTPPPLLSPSQMSGRPARSGRGWMVLALVLMAVLAVMFATKFFSALGMTQARTGGQSGSRLQEVSVDNFGAEDKIAIVDVDGIITSQAWDRSGRNMVDLIEDQLKMAAKDDSVRAVILKVDSPGGEVMASDDISRAILDFQDKHKKPVIAAMGGLAASGGYYVSAPCQWIVANELTLTGSIGVIMHSLNYRGLMDKVGLQPQVFKSGRFKDMLSGSKRPEDVDPLEREMIQSMVMETYGKFKKVVEEGRKRAADKNQGKGRGLAPDWAEYADGRVLTGKQAYEHGFVDQLGNFETAVESAKRIAGISGRAHLVRYMEPFGFSDLFSIWGSSEAKTIKVDVGLDFPKIEAGRVYFLSPTLVH